MRKISRVLALVMCVILMAGLCACGSDTTGTTTAAEAGGTAAGETSAALAEKHDPVTLRFMWWGGDERAEATLKAIEAFEAKYDWITIEPEYGSSDGYQEKLTTQLSSGNAADIIQMGPGWLPGYVKSNDNYFIDFNDYADRIDLTTFESSFLEQNGNIGGKQYGLPTGISGYSFIYNKTLADKAGILFPDSKEEMNWDTLIELGKQLQAYDSSAYLVDIGDSELAACIMRPYLLQLTGSTMVVDATGELGFTEEELVQCLTYIKDLYDNKVIPPLADIAAYSSGDSLQTDPKWISGETYVGMFLSSSTAEVATAACPDCEFAAGYMPVMSSAKNDGFYANCPQYMCVSKSSEHIEEAVMFLDYFYNSEEAAEILTTVRSVPPTSVGQSVCAKLGKLEGIAKDTVDILQASYHGTNEMGLTTEEEYGQRLRDMISQIAYGQGTPEEVAKNGITLMQNFLDSKN